jgi:hypothetical protein
MLFQNVLSWTAMWIRVDSVYGGLDNMYDRRLNGNCSIITINFRFDTEFIKTFIYRHWWLEKC